MSDPTEPAALAGDVAAALAEYDRSRAPEALRHAADVLVRDDGAVPDDPAAALAQGRERLALWLTVLARFHRDLDPAFDPSEPPSRTVTAPVINGEQVPPWIGPEDLKDPAERKQFEDAIAATRQRVEQFTAMFKLDSIHKKVVGRAIESLRNARETLGLPAADIAAALARAELLAADREALRAAAGD